MVEVADEERDRMQGPDWFVRRAGFGSSDPGPYHRAERWCVVQHSSLPSVHPGYRELRPGEATDDIPDDQFVRDGSGVARAVREPMRLRASYLCGDHAALGGFSSLSEAASRVLTDIPDLFEHEYADDLTDLFHSPRGGVRYTFGSVPEQPQQFLARG